MTASVLHVCTSDQFLHFLAAPLLEQARAGLAVHLATRPGHRSRVLGESGLVAVHELPLTRRMAPAEDALALARAVALMRQLRPALVHAHNPKAGLIGMMAAWLAGVQRRVYTVHGLPHVTATGPKRRAVLMSEHVSCRLAHRVLPVSASVEAELIAAKIAEHGAIRRVGSGSADGIDAEWFRPDVSLGRALRRRLGIPAEAPVLLFVGRLHREKGIDDLMRAFTLVQRSWADVELLVVGERDPTDPPEPDALATRPRVHFLGELADPRPAYAAATLFVLPSFREGLPTVVLEAAAMELPTVGYDSLGVRDAVVSGETGLLVATRDVLALAEACVLLLDRSDQRAAMGRAGRAHVQREFQPARVRQGVLEVYAELGLRVPGTRAS